MGSVTCFVVETTGRERRDLRRYASGNCPGHGTFHNALVRLLEEAPVNLTPEGYHAEPPDKPPPSDPRWPTKCDHCGYSFQPEDPHQVFTLTWYVRPETGERHLMRSMPPGAMYDAWWMPRKGPDGKCWVVILPDGNEWMMDGPSKGGGHWTRTGVAPKPTARPSILTPTFHGYLTDGVISPC